MFPESDWTTIAKATLHGGDGATHALDQFYRSYRSPVLAFLSWKGVPESRREDLAHDFFLHLMSHSALRRYNREKGRFRTYLSVALVNFLHSEERRRQAAKRGGGAEIVSLDQAEGDIESSPVQVAPGDEEVLDRHWAHEIMRRALASARHQWQQAGKSARYNVLHDFLPGSTATSSMEEAAQRLGLSAVAVRAELSRLRESIRVALRTEIAATVSAPDEIEAELAHLRAVLHKAPLLAAPG